ncbi:MAG: asparagine--tRNA ligase [Candidatus Helarchaeota archaeon]
MSANKVTIAEIHKKRFLGQQVRVRGWVYRRRQSGKIIFIQIRDRGAILQCILEEKVLGSNLFEKARKISIESSMEFIGTLREEKRSPGGIELVCLTFKLIGLAEVFPITRDQSTQFLLDNRHLWLRSRKLTNIMKVRASVFEAAREWFHRHDYLEVHCPMFITAAVEGGATLFQLPYFNTKAYLTQSSQFYLESLIFSLGNVYTIAPSFRAEKSRTVRHLTEFYMLEAEMPYCDLAQDMAIQEQLISFLCQAVAQKNKAELEFLGRDPADLMIQPPFERISYTEAIEILNDKGQKIEWGNDLGAEDERVLTIDRKSPLFIYNYPREAKAFYHKLDSKDPTVVSCADCLAPEGHGEIIGGGQRIHEKNELLQRITDANLNPKDYEWYIDLRRFGSVPHAGFGLGMERIIKWICKLDNIRDTIPYPRTIRRIYP